MILPNKFEQNLLTSNLLSLDEAVTDTSHLFPSTSIARYVRSVRFFWNLVDHKSKSVLSKQVYCKLDFIVAFMN